MECILDERQGDIEAFVVEGAIKEVYVSQREDVLQALLITLHLGLDVDQSARVFVPVIGDRLFGICPKTFGEFAGGVTGDDYPGVPENLVSLIRCKEIEKLPDFTPCEILDPERFLSAIAVRGKYIGNDCSGCSGDCLGNQHFRVLHLGGTL